MKPIVIKIVSVLLVLKFSTLISFAQISTNELPYSLLNNVHVPIKKVVKLKEPSIQKIQRKNTKNNIYEIEPFSVPIYVSLNIKDGEWKNLPNGGRLWNLTFSVPNASSLDFVFDKFWLPKGGKFFIYNKETKEGIGAITSRFLEGNKNNPSTFSTGIVAGNKITLEYYQPKFVKEKPIINVSRVYYAYKKGDINETIPFNNSGKCQVNINCDEGKKWQKEKEAIARIYFKGPTSGWLATGALINNTSNNFKPLLLTANHWIKGFFDAIRNKDMSNSIFYWHYEQPSCTRTNINPPRYCTYGATVIANNEVSDFALLELKQDPNNINGFVPYYLGWDRTGNPGTGGVSIHHPVGDVKKIATYSTTPSTDKYCMDNDYEFRSSTSFWNVSFDATPNGYSVMEGMSSGAPLINSNKKVIGQLLGPGWCGVSKCNAPSEQNVVYGKFSVSWTGKNNSNKHRRLDHWLDPNNTGVNILDGIVSPKLLISGASTISEKEGLYQIQSLPENTIVEWSSDNPRVHIISGQNTPTVLFKLLEPTYEPNFPTCRPKLGNNIATITAKVTLNSRVITLTKKINFDPRINFKMKESMFFQKYEFFANATDEIGNPYENFTWEIMSVDDENTFVTKTGRVISYNPPTSGYYDITLSADGACGRVSYNTYYYLEPKSHWWFFPNVIRKGIDDNVLIKDNSNTLDRMQFNSRLQTQSRIMNYSTIQSYSNTRTTEKYKIQLWNSLGLVKEIETDQKEYRLSVQGLPKGFYYVHIIKNNKVTRKRLIIK